VAFEQSEQNASASASPSRALGRPLRLAAIFQKALYGRGVRGKMPSGLGAVRRVPSLPEASAIVHRYGRYAESSHPRRLMGRPSASSQSCAFAL